MLRRSALLAGLVAAGCSQPTSSPAPAPDVVVVVPQPEATPAQPPPPVIAKADPPPAFPFPADTAGRMLPKVVAPPAPLPPTERAGSAPAGRTPPARVIDPAPLVKTKYAPPPLLPTKSAGLKPTAPAERLPLTLGTTATAVSIRPVLPVSPGITQKARDVSLPPDLAALGRHVPDRASLDDPTAEPANAAIVGRSPVPALPQAGFLKVALPDPFELAEQVKPKVAPAAEPGLTPVVVSPQRLK